MKRIVGYVLKDKLGCFYDPKLKVFLRPGGDPVLVPKSKIVGTIMERWIAKGSILPVYEEIPDPIAALPDIEEELPEAPVAEEIEAGHAKIAAKKKVAIPRKRK